MSTRTIAMTDRLYSYLLDCSLREPEILTRLRKETAPYPNAVMQISPEQGQFMQLLVRLIGARTTLELGVFTGYSSLSVALALPDDGSMVVCDIDERYTNVARRYWREAGVEHKIDLRLDFAIKTLDRLIAEGKTGAFDFAFIDADKENEHHYYEQCLTLIRPGGLIAIDNVLWGGAVADPGYQDEATVAIRELNERLREDDRIELSLVPIADGLTLAMKRG
jgi:predicted O-methyltransferase YrrM